MRLLSPWTSSRLARALALALLAVVANAAGAQEFSWIALDGAPPGTAAEVVLVPQQSNPFQTTFDLVIHGFYTRPRVGADNVTYQELEVPGLERLSIQGAPALPVARRLIAIVSGAAAATAPQMTPLSDPLTFTMDVWPQPIPAMDDPFGTPETFVRDESIYGSSAPYPQELGSGSGTFMAHGSIPAARIECHPVRWNPASQQLTIYPITRWRFSHDGTPHVFASITKDRNRLADDTFLNWGAVDAYVPANLLHYQGEYLFLYPSAYAAALKQLFNQKSTRGFTVTRSPPNRSAASPAPRCGRRSKPGTPRRPPRRTLLPASRRPRRHSLLPPTARHRSLDR